MMSTLLLASLIATLALGSVEQEPPLVPLPSGWEQLEIESYHGPEGYYHDGVSGAVIRYYTGSVPDMLGARLSAGAPCVATNPQPAPPCLLNAGPKKTQVFVGPYGQGVYATYWIPRGSLEQEARGVALALTNPLARRLYSGHSYLERDARESDLQALAIGMSLGDVLRVLGDPLNMSASAAGGFQLEFIVWGKWPGPSGELTNASRTVKLLFSRERRLLNKPRGRPTSG